MLSSLPSEVVSFICSFSDANTFLSFTLTNSSYNQNQSLYQEYIIKKYSPELFGFPIWDHAIFDSKGFLPNGKTSQRKLQFSRTFGARHNLNYPAQTKKKEKLGQFSAQREALRWKDLFYRINSKKYLNIYGGERKFPVYFNETILNILQRINETCDIDKMKVSNFPESDPIGGPVLLISNKSNTKCVSYRYYNKEPIPIFEYHQMSSLLGSIITQDKNYLFDKLSVFVLQ
jgi:hypothetical protein